MSKTEKVYANGIFFKTLDTEYGAILKASISVNDFVEFLKENQDEGWVNIDILERREVSDKGHTHYSVLNQWKPDAKKSTSKSRSKKEEVAEEDDLPF